MFDAFIRRLTRQEVAILDGAAKSGLLEELKHEIDQRQSEARATLIGHRKAIPKDPPVELAKVGKDLTEVNARIESLNSELIRAREDSRLLSSQSYGISIQFEARYSQIDREIFAATPEWLKDLRGAADTLAQDLRASVHLTLVEVQTMAGKRKTLQSNVERVEDAVKCVTAFQRLLEKLILEEDDLAYVEDQAKSEWRALGPKAKAADFDWEEFERRRLQSEEERTSERKAKQEDLERKATDAKPKRRVVQELDGLQ